MDKESVLNLLFPPKCMFCGEITQKGKPCPACVEQAQKLLIPKNARSIQHNCFKKLDECISFYYYTDIVRESLLKAKFVNCSSFVRYFLDFIPENFAEIYKNNNIDMFISMPVHKSKHYDREFVLVNEMASHIAKIYNLQYNKNLVTKIRKTENQHDLPLSKRKDNLKDAFRVNNDIKGKNILVLDDIISTGYSLEEVAKSLKKAGAATVIAVTFAYNKL